MMRRGCERFALTCTFLLAAAGPLAADEEPLGELTAPAPLPALPALPAVGAVPPAVLSEARKSAEPDPRLADVDRELDEIEDLVRDAHFRSALSVASSTRALLDELEP
ncbi:MAG: hypothetical protein O7G30_03610, partial [Proteobacteria bacterium]|nr:hypothetical protein [Pseudomonadota bacterium]